MCNCECGCDHCGKDEDYYADKVMDKIIFKFGKILNQRENVIYNIFRLKITITHLQTNLTKQYMSELEFNNIIDKISKDVELYNHNKEEIEELMVKNITKNMKYPNKTTVISKKDFLELISDNDPTYDDCEYHYDQNYFKNFPTTIMDIKEIEKLITVDKTKS